MSEVFGLSSWKDEFAIMRDVEGCGRSRREGQIQEPLLGSESGDDQVMPADRQVPVVSESRPQVST